MQLTRFNLSGTTHMGNKTSKRREAKKVAAFVSSIEAQREIARAHIDRVKKLSPKARMKEQVATDEAQLTLATLHDSAAEVTEIRDGVFKKQRVTR